MFCPAYLRYIIEHSPYNYWLIIQNRRYPEQSCFIFVQDLLMIMRDVYKSTYIYNIIRYTRIYVYTYNYHDVIIKNYFQLYIHS